MKKAEKSSSTSTNATNQATAQERPFFEKAGGGQFFEPTKTANIQAKLTINQPGDRYEREADSMAEKVVSGRQGDMRQGDMRQGVMRQGDDRQSDNRQSDMRQGDMPKVQRMGDRDKIQMKENCTTCGEKVQMMADNRLGDMPKVQRMGDRDKIQMKENCSKCDEKVQMKEEKDKVQMKEGELQKKPLNEDTPPSASRIEGDLMASKGLGSKLPNALLNEMEAGFEADLDNVRLHTGENAAKMAKTIQARAFTHGNDIYFNEGQYNPNSREGRILLAHELTHTIQQNGRLTQKNKIEQTQREQVQRAEDQTPEDLKKELEAADQAQVQAIDPGPALAKKKKAEQVKTNNAQSAKAKHGKKKGGGGKKSGKKGGKGGSAKSKASAALAANEAAFKKTLGTVGKDLSDASAFACAKADQKATNLAENEQTHDDATQKQQQTDAAVVPPTQEGQSQSNTEQVQTLDGAAPPKPDKEAARATMNQAIEEAMPTDIEEVNAFGSKGKAQVAGNEILSTVNADVGAVQDGYNDIEQPPAPKPSETPTELPPQEAAPTTAALNLGKGAVPNLQPEHTDVDEFGKQSDDLLVQEGIPEDQLEMVDSGDLADANAERKGLKKKIKEEPKKIQQAAKQETQDVEKGLQKEEAKGKSDMRQKRNAGLTGTKDKQQKTKSALELKREQVTAHINGIYERAKKSVTAKLANLEQQNLVAFDAGQQEASKLFEKEVKRDIDAWKRDRYSGFWAGAKWLKDKFVGIDHFPAVQKALTDGRSNYIRRIDALIVAIDNANQQVIRDCKLELANADKEMKGYVKNLSPELKATGQAALKEMQTKLAEMDKFIDEQKNKLREKLCSKREEAIKKIDEKIEKMKEEMSGLLSKLGNLILDALVKFFKWALEKAGYGPDKLMEIINKGKSVIKAIVTSPGQFFKNLARAVKGGVDAFRANIQQHLIKGVVGWLTGAMSDAGLQLPAQWDIKGIFFLLLQILNLTKDAILKKLAHRIGQPVVDGAMKVAGFVQRVVSDGPIALWDMLVEQAEMLKEKVMESIRGWIVAEMIKQGLIKLVSMLNPVGAIVQLIIGIYNAVMFFVENWSRIVEFVKSVFSSIADIALGRLGGAMATVERALGMTIPIILAFIARMLGLSGIGKAIRGAIEKIRGPIDKIVDKGLDAVGKVVVGMVKKVKGVVDKGKEKVKEGVKKLLEWWNLSNSFTTKKGEKHKVFLKKKGNNAEIKVASQEKTVEAFLKEVKPNVPDGKDKDYQTAVTASNEVESTKDALAKENDDKKKQKLFNTLKEKNSILAQKMIPLFEFMAPGDLPPTVLPPMSNNIRATSIIARFISKKMVPDGETADKHKGNLLGWDDIQNSGLRVKENWVKMHLLHHNLGGKATDTNLTPGKSSLNQRFYRAVEKPALDLISNNTSVLWYKVNISYHSSTNYIDSINASYGEHKKDDNWSIGTAIKQWTTSVEMPNLSQGLETVSVNEAGQTVLGRWEIENKKLSKEFIIALIDERNNSQGVHKNFVRYRDLSDLLRRLENHPINPLSKSVLVSNISLLSKAFNKKLMSF